MIQIKNVLVYKVQSLIDGGWRLSVDTDQSQAQALMELAANRESLFHVTFTPADLPTSPVDELTDLE